MFRLNRVLNATALIAAALSASCSWGPLGRVSAESSYEVSGLSVTPRCDGAFRKVAASLASESTSLLLTNLKRKEVWFVGEMTPSRIDAVGQALSANLISTLRIASRGGSVLDVLGASVWFQEAAISVIVEGHCSSACHYLLLSPTTYVCDGTLVALHRPYFDSGTNQFDFSDERFSLAEELSNELMERLDPEKSLYANLANCMSRMVRPYDPAIELQGQASNEPRRDMTTSGLPEWWAPEISELQRLGLPFQRIAAADPFDEVRNKRTDAIVALVGPSVTVSTCDL